MRHKHVSVPRRPSSASLLLCSNQDSRALCFASMVRSVLLAVVLLCCIMSTTASPPQLLLHRLNSGLVYVFVMYSCMSYLMRVHQVHR